MTVMDSAIAGFAERAGEEAGQLTVSLSYELVQLLSDQLYQSPLKAIEELVVNAYDAGADVCRVFVPLPGETERPFVAVYDDGSGMDYSGLTDLWHIGHSNKRAPEVEQAARRKQIGRFGVGKLATYAIANKVTYISRKGQEILAVTLDYGDFTANPTGTGNRVQLSVRRVTDWDTLRNDGTFRAVCAATGNEVGDLFIAGDAAWTFAILEALKPKVASIRLGRLVWVLSTAMPLDTDFLLFLNKEAITSAKVDFEVAVEFTVGELPAERIAALNEATRAGWRVDGNALKASTFPIGISGRVRVFERSIHAGKSADLGRSHGFFIKVRKRLVNQDDPLFGLTPLSFEVFKAH